VTYDVLVVGAGTAGCAAALAARRASAGAVLLIDLADRPGGALAAMGLRTNQDISALARAGIQPSFQTALVEIAAGLRLRLLSSGGAQRAIARAVVLATGGREATRGNLALPGSRPAGVLTASAALRLLTATGRRPGNRVVVAGAGRWARGVAEALQRAGAAIAAIVPAVARIEGWPRVTSVVLEDGRQRACDLLVLATALHPWLPPALAHAAALPGVFVAGTAARGELDEREAAADGEAAGRKAAAWAMRDKLAR
jgi:NADPH-dependent 2,4-dienoyl-CoA reductase/sulfur reductase-like enzyme